MGVTGGKAGSIVDQDLIAETVVPAADQHGAAVGGQDRCSARRGNINTLMTGVFERHLSQNGRSGCRYRQP